MPHVSISRTRSFPLWCKAARDLRDVTTAQSPFGRGTSYDWNAHVLNVGVLGALGWFISTFSLLSRWVEWTLTATARVHITYQLISCNECIHTRMHPKGYAILAIWRPYKECFQWFGTNKNQQRVVSGKQFSAVKEWPMEIMNEKNRQYSSYLITYISGLSVELNDPVSTDISDSKLI